MKKKVALLLVVVMVMALLPMDALGVHPPQFTQLVRPNDNALNYILSIDARELSGAIIPEGGNLFLEFEISGENAGFRVFRNNEPIRELVNGVLRERNERDWPEVIIPTWAERYTGTGGQLAFRIEAGAQFTGGDNGTAWISRLQQMSGGTTPPALTWSVGGGWQPTRVDGRNAALRDVLQSASGVSIWSDEFTNGVRRRMLQDRGFNPSDASQFGVDTAPMEHWRRIEMPLVELLGTEFNWHNVEWMDNFRSVVGGVDRFALPEMEGWITVQLPAVAPNPGAQIAARLRSISQHGAISTLRDLGTFNLAAGGHAEGVTIESLGVATMTEYARLNPIRITEETPGMFAPHVEGLVEGAGHHIVRLVAPENFLWDEWSGPLTITGNPVTWPGRPGNNYEGIQDMGGMATMLDMWLNPNTNRHEIYIHLHIPSRDMSTLSSRDSLAWVDINGLVMLPQENAQTTSGDIAVDVWIGTTNGTVMDQWWIGSANPRGTAGNIAWDLYRGWEVFEVGRTLEDGTVRETRFGWFGENDAPGSMAPAGVPGWRQDGWSHMGLVVAACMVCEEHPCICEAPCEDCNESPCICDTPQPTPTPTPPPANATILSVSTAFASPGDEVSIQLSISNNPGFESMLMRIAFPNELTLTDYALPEPYLYVNFGSPDDLSQVGNYVFMGWTGGTEEDITRNGELLTLTFEVCPHMATRQVLPITVTFENAYDGEDTPTNANQEELDIHIRNGEVRVQPVRIGDMNGDGRVTSADASILARHLIGQNVTIDLRAANITCSGGGPTPADLTRLVRTLFGHYPRLCPHEPGTCTNPLCN